MVCISFPPAAQSESTGSPGTTPADRRLRRERNVISSGHPRQRRQNRNPDPPVPLCRTDAPFHRLTGVPSLSPPCRSAGQDEDMPVEHDGETTAPTGCRMPPRRRREIRLRTRRSTAVQPNRRRLPLSYRSAPPRAVRSAHREELPPLKEGCYRHLRVSERKPAEAAPYRGEPRRCSAADESLQEPMNVPRGTTWRQNAIASIRREPRRNQQQASHAWEYSGSGARKDKG